MSSLAQTAQALLARTDRAQRAAVAREAKVDHLREALRHMDGPATASQLVAAAGLPKDTNAHGLLANDVAYGLVARDGVRYVMAPGGQARKKKVQAAIALLRSCGWSVTLSGRRPKGAQP